MKQGMTLQSLASELDRQVKARKDFIATTNALTMHAMESDVRIGGLNGGAGMALTDYAHGQIASQTGIPKRYYDRMKAEEPALLASNVNTWMHKTPERKLLRTLDNRVRAMLSDRYRPLDNYDLASVALPIFKEHSAEVVSCDLTERRLYLKTTISGLQAEITTSTLKNDIVQAGVVVSNSEIGAGALKIEPMVYRLVCLNGLIAADSTMRKYHVGGRASADDGIYEYLTTEARQADDKAFWLKARDILRGAFNRDLFNALVARLESSTQDKIKKKLDAFVEDVTAQFMLPEPAKESVLKHLIEGGDLSRYGTANAFTRASQDVDDYELATDMERAGGQIIELTASEWKEVAA